MEPVKRARVGVCPGCAHSSVVVTMTPRCGHERLLPQAHAHQQASSHLCMRKVIALVVVKRQAQAALILPQVVAHEVGVLAEIDRLQRKPPQTLTAVNRLRRTKASSQDVTVTTNTVHASPL